MGELGGWVGYIGSCLTGAHTVQFSRVLLDTMRRQDEERDDAKQESQVCHNQSHRVAIIPVRNPESLVRGCSVWVLGCGCITDVWEKNRAYAWGKEEFCSGRCEMRCLEHPRGRNWDQCNCPQFRESQTGLLLGVKTRSLDKAAQGRRQRRRKAEDRESWRLTKLRSNFYKI